MSSPTPAGNPGPLSLDCAEDFRRVRDVFDRAGYTDARLREHLGVADLMTFRDNGTPPLLWRTRGGTPLDTLARLFLIGVPVEVEAACRAIVPLTLDEWTRAGFVQVDGTTVTAPVRLLPYQGLLAAFDPGWPLTTRLRPDHVMGISTASLRLANLTVRRPVLRALDLGTGCGIQAFLAAAHSDQVVAVDANPRAVAYTAFNARLNGLGNVDARTGDLFEPVRGQTFDLIVTNPPFVISPEKRFTFRDSGLPGDQLGRDLVRTVPTFLSEGGFCQILYNWVHVAGQDWKQRLAGWFAGTGCDAWVLRGKTLDLAVYAMTWSQQTDNDDPQAQAERFDAWMAYYERERIEAISYGLFTLRRASGRPNWFRCDDIPEEAGPGGDAILRGFAARDFLETVRDEAALLNARMRLAPEMRLENRLQPTAEGWTPAGPSRIRLAQGLAYTGTVTPPLVALLDECRGKQPLGAILAKLAAATGQDQDRLTADALRIVRRFVEQGFLLPAGEGTMA